MFRLILEESTHVTKSSIFLMLVSTTLYINCDGSLPCNEICRVRYNICTNSYMALLDKGNGSLDMICHA